MEIVAYGYAYGPSKYFIALQLKQRLEEDDEEETVLESFFPSKADIVFKHFDRHTLFTICKSNPFFRLLRPNPKNAAFRVLRDVAETLNLSNLDEKVLPIDFIERFRVFKQCDTAKIRNYCYWYPLAQRLYRPSFEKLFDGSIPAHRQTSTAWKLYRLSQRLKELDEDTFIVPREFYECELLSDGCVGIMCNDYATYVSPMVVAKQSAKFKDVNHETCNVWIPLFKDPENFRTKALPELMRKGLRTKIIKDVIETLISLDHIEKYKFMLVDMEIMWKVLVGETLSFD
jgi:hypothetical protein